MIRKERLTAKLEGDFVVFLIGMRINQPLKVHKWLPVAAAMPRMLKELYRQPERGLLHAEFWFSRTIVVLQYWRSMEQLLAYAKDKEAEHLPAWRAFNKSVGTDGSVGIWHETYAVSPGTYENIYVNMPPFGLGRAGTAQSVVEANRSAAARLKATSAQE
ncbi:protein of unknown function [Variovorax sp. OK605]|jgi:hypothetical protein|uniref:DUF4188 domain-containing protein n=1 Tax=unclassified Variovorax TaxID=663243 RepID=UPI0008B86FCE|nr:MULTISPECIES: DUF4188 domain-containing protein [unclassified Variovorax]SEK09069.1 protein of unknown function [Variovorax sp. OK202]SFD60531.1 protein of unknown function [Variovorax sp. OK212]SFP83171.1 protein of unknown function [Variovorax sp. OK605]